MTESAKSALKTKTTPNQPAIKSHFYTMAAAFAGVVFGVLGSMGFVGNYLDSQFAAQTAALDKRMVATAPASASSSDLCYGTSTASANAAKPTAHTAVAPVHTAAMPAAMVGGKGAESTSVKPSGTTTPFVSQMINGSISNTGPNSTATINASNNYTSTTNNTNNVSVSNNNSQTSNTGSATSSTNTNGGSAQSGSSHNENSTNTAIGISN